MVKNETCYKRGHVRTLDFTVFNLIPISVVDNDLVTQLNEVKWPDEVDFKGAIHGNLWHFFQISLKKTKKTYQFHRLLTTAA